MFFSVPFLHQTTRPVTLNNNSNEKAEKIIKVLKNKTKKEREKEREREKRQTKKERERKRERERER